MKYLTDTHTFLWFIEGSPKLSEFSKSLIENEDNVIYFSIISLWEISIKTALNKLSIKSEYESVIFDIEKMILIFFQWLIPFNKTNSRTFTKTLLIG
jgi:PIN domain nuclease of toxin-antitoxin system